MKNQLTHAAHQIREKVNQNELWLQNLVTKPVFTALNSQNRTIKQILGHLVDSASNNTHRIVHLQYNTIPLEFPNYATNGNNDRWIAIQNYQEEDWNNIIQLWKYSNLHLAHVIEQVNEEKLSNTWISGPDNSISLYEMITNYTAHIDLHLGEIKELANLK